jgi:hypothetical protein
MPTARARRLALAQAVLAGLLVLAAIAHVHRYLAPFEDSYITYRYAENLAHGLGPVYNAGERVEGATSLLWVFWLGAVSWLGGAVPAFSVAASVIAALALLPLTSLLQRRLQGERGVPLFAPAFVAASGTWAYYAGTGMETTTFAAVITGAGVLFCEPTRKRAAWAAILLGVGTWLRPEGVGYLVAFLFALASRRESRRGVLPAGGIALSLFLPFLWWRVSYYGAWLPNTYHAKAAFGPELLWRGAEHLVEYLTLHGGGLGLLGLGLLLRKERWSGPAAVLTCWCTAALLNTLLVGGDTFAFHRFLLPAVPALGASLGLAFTAPAGTREPSRVARALSLLGKVNAAVENARRIRVLQKEHGSFSAWLDAHHPLPPDEWRKLFKRTFVFTGGEIVGSFLLSTGYLPGAHEESCPVFRKVLKARPAWTREGKRVRG